MIVKVVIFVLLAVVRINTQPDDCNGLPDGPCCSLGCESYVLCTDEVGQNVDCDPPDVYNDIIGGCDTLESTPPPCGENEDCSTLPDRSYPDMTEGEECESFFSCSFGVNRGITPCNPPNSTGLLVFDYLQQICNWRELVPPPCGTYGVPLF